MKSDNRNDFEVKNNSNLNILITTDDNVFLIRKGSSIFIHKVDLPVSISYKLGLTWFCECVVKKDTQKTICTISNSKIENELFLNFE